MQKQKNNRKNNSKLKTKINKNKTVDTAAPAGGLHFLKLDI